MSVLDWVGIISAVTPAILYGYKVFGMLKDIQKDQKILKMDTTRMQCLQMMQHDPTNRFAITFLHDKYKDMGGNSYLDAEYAKWEKKYNKPAKAKK